MTSDPFTAAADNRWMYFTDGELESLARALDDSPERYSDDPPRSDIDRMTLEAQAELARRAELASILQDRITEAEA